jgi:hypothetical protein
MADKTLTFDVLARDKASRTFDQIGTSSDRLATKVNGSNRKMGAGFSKFGRALEKDVGFRVDKAHNGLSLLTNFIGGPFGAGLMAGVVALDTISTVLSIVSVANIKAAASWVVHKTAMLATAAATKLVAAGMWLVNAAIGPMGLAVLAIAAVGVGLVVAYKKSQTFRNIVNAAFRETGLAALAFAKIFLQVFKFITDAYLNYVGIMVHGAAQAFGWIPGVGPKLKGAAKAFDRFRSSVDKTFDAAIGKVDEWDKTLRNAPKIAKLKGDIRDLTGKLATAKKQLRDPDLTRERKAQIRANIAQLEAALVTARARLNGLQDRTVHVTVQTNFIGGTSGGRGGGRRQHGGPVWPGGAFVVGEQRPELFVPNQPGRIVPRVPATRSGNGDSGRVVIELRSGGTRLDDLLVEVLSRAVRVRGGNVQLVLGGRA